MNRVSIVVNELQGGRNAVEAPFDCLFAKTLALDVPAHRRDLFCYEVDIRFVLNHIDDSYDARMTECSQLPSGILC